MKKLIGVVADDITGGNDIGIMFAKNGLVTEVYRYHENMEFKKVEDVDVIIIDTDSRLDEPKVAAEKVYNSTKSLMKIPCDMYFNKTCSVFRGNIGVEFDAMQEALGIDKSIVILGFPANGRVTKNGLHYVNGVLLENSQFANDPIHPMKESNVVKILESQTEKTVGIINYNIVKQGEEILKSHIEKMKKDFSYIILDVTEQEDLKIIAKAAAGELNLCGSSAIAEELPKAFGNVKELKFEDGVYKSLDKNGVLVLAGSLTPQTLLQVNYLKEIGVETIEFDTLSIYAEEGYARCINEIVAKAIEVVSKGRDILIHTSNDRVIVKKTKEIGYNLGLKDNEIGKKISSALTAIVKEVYERTGFRKIVVAGGDTSEAVSEGLNIEKMRIIEEIEPGLPNMFGYNSMGRLLMVLKSGSFGTKEFLKKAIDNLKCLEERLCK
ncbi:Uncharacterized conserved protein YgbK, DUF1537 family [Clostridium sp. USBA 49]|uniref:four-carbon acid sugar kinase family protein n=1 Tax=Clostridium sp. USBA 49 TaxID=1881060 RepID=UPI0009D09BB2|nr:four-carbon acid sugar kinase family protein [Clostridium sp. USBA 49]SKA85402.1 Uncharacterized conserved protein YgbK, DUF1537 family [Clostridium sp. USBA 49]